MQSPSDYFALHCFDEEEQTSETQQPLPWNPMMWSQDVFTSPPQPRTLSTHPMPSVESLELFDSVFLPSPPLAEHSTGPAASQDQQGYFWPSIPATAVFNVDAPNYEYFSTSHMDTLYNGTNHTVLMHQDLAHGPLMTHDATTKFSTPQEASIWEEPSPSPTPTASTLDDQSPSQHHNYRRIIAPIPRETLDASIELCQTEPTKTYRCLWPGCPKRPFRKKCNAREHVYNHLVETKPFECIVCLEKFSSENTAKRHRDTQVKGFSCPTCHKTFSRKDYRNLHQKKKRCHNLLVPA